MSQTPAISPWLSGPALIVISSVDYYAPETGHLPVAVGPSTYCYLICRLLCPRDRPSPRGCRAQHLLLSNLTIIMPQRPAISPWLSGPALIVI
ncbi:hypothetical protein RRG08_056652 [Elysia crispata]|uniref:Uncharacterized protein n=1 Tax=Elysia crispata TaxID=231223 RepID=A0AAE0YGR2_9GAST|nr:hypothetical protein RRG08_056652 [Elysia crispata]